jgi:hypothetical protein
MIHSGDLNKFITIEQPCIYEHTAKSLCHYRSHSALLQEHVKSSDSQSLMNQNDEIVALPRLLFTMRKFPALDLPNHYRILYNRNKYIIQNINDEDRDTVIILAQLYNE